MASVLGQFLASEPNVPKLKPIDIQAEQLKTISGNTAALPATTKFAEGVNQSNLDQWLKGIRFAFPDFDEISKTISGNALSMARGEVPISDRNMDWIKSSARAYGGGYSGSQADSFGRARDYGLRTLDVMERGQNAFQSWMKALDTPNPIDMSQMFLTATQGIDYTFKEREQQFQRDYVANINDAQYSLGSRAGRAADAVADAVVSILGAYVGGLGK